MNRMAVKIKEARLKAKMSEKDLAKACGQNINYILQIETGKKVINEKIAEQILKILGEKVEFFQDAPQDAPVLEAPKLAKIPAVSKPADMSITPNDSWAGALSGVIKQFSITDEISGQTVDYKELSIISKKIEGIHYEKIQFVKVIESELPKLRIAKGDVVTLNVTKEIQNNGVYYIEYNQKRMIRQVSKIQNNLIVFSKGHNEEETEVDQKNIKIIGKIIKVEFYV